MNYPIQPLYIDERGVLRFKANAIVRYLLNVSGIDLDKLADLPFTDEDRQQFAQLIGYSLSGYGDLSYVSDDAYGIAERMHEDPAVIQERVAADYMADELHALRNALREPMARLFGVHPDDLKG